MRLRGSRLVIVVAALVAAAGSAGSAAAGRAVDRVGTTVTVVSSVNPTTPGQKTTVTATVAPTTPDSAMPTGTITWVVGSIPSPGNPLKGGKATLDLSGRPGSVTVTARYTGDAHFSPSTSSQLTQVTGKIATTSILTSTISPATYDQQPTLTILVRPASASQGVPTGTVTLTSIGATAFTVKLPLTGGSARYAGAFNPGDSEVSAGYEGDNSFGGAVSAALVQSVDKADPTVRIDVSPRPAVFAGPVTVTVTVSGAAGAPRKPSGLVTVNPFDAQGSAKGTLSDAGTASFASTGGASTTGYFGADYAGDAFYNPAPALPVAVTVTKARSALKLDASATSVTVGDSVTLTAQVTGPATAGRPVSFSEPGTDYGDTPVDSGGTARTTVKGLAAGRHTFRATFDGGNNVADSADTVEVVVVERPVAAPVVVAPVVVPTAPRATTKPGTKATPRAPVKTSVKTPAKTPPAPKAPAKTPARPARPATTTVPKVVPKPAR